MPTYLKSIPDDLRDWALQQPLFWTASAPRKGEHINVSPKGLTSSSLHIFDPNHCAYLDQTGSGCETIAHIYDNERLTLAWCSFDSMCRILRFYCRGHVVELGDPAFDAALERMGKTRQSVAGVRAVILCDVWKVSTSCGFSVPLLIPERDDDAVDVDEHKKKSVVRHFKDRDVAAKFVKQIERKDPSGMDRYRSEWNRRSLDGLPGMREVRKALGEPLLLQDVQARFEKQFGDVPTVLVSVAFGMLLMMLLKAVF